MKSSTKKSNTKKEVLEEKNEKTVKKNSEIKKEVKLKKQKKAKRKKFVLSFVLSLIVLLVSAGLLYPALTNTKFGLDLKGGFEVLYEVQDIDGKDVSKESVTNTYKTILKRIDILGVSEPEISIEGNNIRIQLAGVKDKESAKETLSSMANLTFRNSKDELVMTSDVLKGNGVKVVADENNVGNYYLTLDIADVNTFHEKTEEIRKSGDVMVIWLDFDEEKDNFKDAQATCGSLNNSRCISYASINGELTTSSVTLSGNFKYDEARSLADLINSGSLPTKLVEISSKTVDASFGSDALRNTFIAGVVAVSLIILLMIIIYRFAGFISGIGIITYTMLLFAVYNLVGGRLTLASIAAAVIGIGMAIDSVVLSYERIKEELRNNKTLEDAFINGNKGSLVSIIDSNITTLIAAIILFIFGESTVKGFATMLIISIIVTLIVMVFIVRMLLKGFVKSGKFDNHTKAFIGVSTKEKKKLNISKNMKYLSAIPVIIILIGAVCFYFNGLNLSIDFKGGSSISLTADEKIEANLVEGELELLGYDVITSENVNGNSVYVKVNNVLNAEETATVEKHFKDMYKDSTTSIGTISNAVKVELIKNAVKSLIYAIIGIIVYVTLRFTFRYGISSIITLLHDVVIIFIVFSLFKFEISTIFIAAILSIIGYSINDTIVVFDRIRENKKKLYNDRLKSYEDLKELVNTSLNQVISRSIITSVTTLIPVVCLIIMGSHEISTFNYALLVGLIAGTYSSLFVATRLWMLFEKRHIGKTEKKKWYEVDDEDEIEELKVKGINC